MSALSNSLPAPCSDFTNSHIMGILSSHKCMCPPGAAAFRVVRRRELDRKRGL